MKSEFGNDKFIVLNPKDEIIGSLPTLKQARKFMERIWNVKPKQELSVYKAVAVDVTTIK